MIHYDLFITSGNFVNWIPLGVNNDLMFSLVISSVFLISFVLCLIDVEQNIDAPAQDPSESFAL